ncbi:peptidase M48, partial [mine drainage metagenome]
NADELQSVLAHEIGHLRHNDVVVMTVIAFIPMLAYIIAQSMFFSSIFGGMNSKNNSGSYLMLFGLLAFVVYIMAQLFMMSLSRTRESYADSYSASYTKHPEYLASSLVKITASNVGTANAAKDSTIARSFYIVDYFNSDKDIKDIKNHIKEIKDLLPDLDIDRFVQQAKDSKKNVWGLINGAFATHPPAYRRLIDLAKEKAELNGRKEAQN